MKGLRHHLIIVFVTVFGVGQFVNAQIHLVTDDTRRAQLEQEARIERMVMVPMRDGNRLATRIYIPKDTDGPVPAIFWRTPYNFSELSEGSATRPSAYLKFALDAVRNGYAFVIQNERGKYFSEGEWEILGFPRTDGYDALSWIADQDWSSGKVATMGCSSTAEWQPALGAMNHPAHAAAIPMAYGAGIGQVGEYYEQGNFYRGGAMQESMVTWMFGNQNTQRPTLPKDLSREDLIRLAKYTDLEASAKSPDWGKAHWHLPLSELYEAYGGPKGEFNKMASHGPADEYWKDGGLFNEGEDYFIPTLWVSSWYDLSTAPNLEIYNHIRENASTEKARESQYKIVAPTIHCEMYRLKSPHMVGDMNMGDVDFQFDETIWSFLNHYVKGEQNKFPEKQAKVRYFAMGENTWKESDVWPPEGVSQKVYYLNSQDGANSLFGDGVLTTEKPVSNNGRDQFTYDPANPVPSLGGNSWGDAGSYDNRDIEARDDVLVYTTEAFTEATDVTGKMEIMLYVSSDAKDTDFTVKLLDVYPDGRAMNIDETIQRARYREGYDKEVLMNDGEVYALKVSSITTSNIFRPGHKLRIEVSSSNFPRFERNLNMGTDNFRETNMVKANNVIHHSAEFPSYISVPIKE